jgi:hypothetical protein
MERALVLASLLACAVGCRASNPGGGGGGNGGGGGARDLSAGGGGDLAGGGPFDLAWSGDLGAAWWRPGTAALPWQWELAHEIVTTSAADLGPGGNAYNGAPAAAPVVYDIDGFDNSASDVAALHALGKKVICYVEVGALENYRPDAAMFPAATQGMTVPGYASEKYLDINSATVVANIEARIMMCAQKGFDAVEPDIDDSYTDDTGFTISEAQNVAYLTTLSRYAHTLGLAWGLKNGGDGARRRSS